MRDLNSGLTKKLMWKKKLYGDMSAFHIIHTQIKFAFKY